MRVVTNEQRIKRGRQVGTVMFFVSLVILIGGLILTNFFALSTEVLMAVPCLVLPLGLITTVISVRLTNQYVRQPRPEIVLREGLQGINRRSILFNYFPTANHILLTPHGIYSITTRFQTTRFKVEGEKWTNYKARGPLAPFFLFIKQEGLGDPFAEAREDAKKVQAVVDKAVLDSGIVVQPLVIFISGRAGVEIIDPAIPVAYASPQKKPSIKALLRDDKKEKQKDDFQAFDEEEMQAIEEHLEAALTESQYRMMVEEED
jgi:hypothetical protein